MGVRAPSGGAAFLQLLLRRRSLSLSAIPYERTSAKKTHLTRIFPVGAVAHGLTVRHDKVEHVDVWIAFHLLPPTKRTITSLSTAGVSCISVTLPTWFFHVASRPATNRSRSSSIILLQVSHLGTLAAVNFVACAGLTMMRQEERSLGTIIVVMINTPVRIRMVL